jgi:hypothetical protein
MFSSLKRFSGLSIILPDPDPAQNLDADSDSDPDPRGGSVSQKCASPLAKF